MTQIDPHIESSLKAAFHQFQESLLEQLRVRVRRSRAAELRGFLATPDVIDLEAFNREVWVLESRTLLNGKDITGKIFGGQLSKTPALSAEEIGEIESALQLGTLEFHGNAIWGSGTRVYGPMIHGADESKTEHIQQALHILNRQDLKLIEKAQQIEGIPGFGPNIATGLVMVFHPTEFAIYNAPPKKALRDLGLPAESLEPFQASMRLLKDRLGAEDFIELDWFLFLRQAGQDDTPERRFWWVNQGSTYQYERGGGYLWAPKTGRDGKTVFAHHANLAHVRPGDAILHYAAGALRAASQAIDGPLESPRPDELPATPWDEAGYLVQAEYYELPEPIPLQDIPQPWRDLNGGPFTRQGSVKQGYLFPIPAEFVQKLVGQFDRPWPDFMPSPSTKAVWIFQANPAYYDLEQRLHDVKVGDEETWTVSRYRDEMSSGDTVLL